MNATVEAWADPLSESERQEIETALVYGSRNDLAHWLRHCLVVMDAQRAQRIVRDVEAGLPGMPE